MGSEGWRQRGSCTGWSGDVRMTYIKEQDGWVYVRLTDGIEGWIRDYLVKDIG